MLRLWFTQFILCSNTDQRHCDYNAQTLEQGKELQWTSWKCMLLVRLNFFFLNLNIIQTYKNMKGIRYRNSWYWNVTKSHLHSKHIYRTLMKFSFWYIFFRILKLKKSFFGTGIISIFFSFDWWCENCNPIRNIISLTENNLVDGLKQRKKNENKYV